MEAVRAASAPSPGPRWVSFDCFGTLVDWHTGFARLLQPIAGPKTAALQAAYHRFERMLEADRPYRLYKDVLTEGLRRAAAEVGLGFDSQAASRLVAGWANLPIFADVEPMLAGLRALGCRLAVLTNCDEDLFARTQAQFSQPFDQVVTAERVGQYKPNHAHFRQFAAATGVAPSHWVHVACSWFHDIRPAQQMGVARVWLDRDRTGETPGPGTRQVPSAAAVVPSVRALMDLA